MSDRQDVCWFAALGTCRCPTNAVVGVQCRTQVDNLPPDTQAVVVVVVVAVEDRSYGHLGNVWWARTTA